MATRLLARAIEQERLAAERPDDRDRSPFETIARQTLIAEVAEFMTEPGGGQPAAVLRTVVRFAPQGSVRARALRLLAAVEPRHERRRLAAAALCDSSEPTLVAAIEIVGSNGFTEMSDRLVALAASPRPVLRRHAKHVLRSLGQRVESVDYSTAVLDAVNELASRLVEAGLEFHDVLPWAADASNEAQHEAIVEAAEAYLDGVAGASAAPDDGHGVLLLVAAARSRHDRITIRLWEHEIRFADSNEEMLARGLTALARARLISGLIACRQGDRSAALDDLAGLAGLARRSATDVRLQIYVENAAAVSAAIWRGTRNQFTGLRGPDGGDAATRLATTVLGSLDCTDRAGRLEAHRRIDAWCGIESSPQSGDSRSTRMAN